MFNCCRMMTDSDIGDRDIASSYLSTTGRKLGSGSGSSGNATRMLLLCAFSLAGILTTHVLFTTLLHADNQNFVRITTKARASSYVYTSYTNQQDNNTNTSSNNNLTTTTVTTNTTKCSSPPAATTIKTVPPQQQDNDNIWICPPGQKLLQLYPPELLNMTTSTTTNLRKLCGHVFRPLEFFEFGPGRPFLQNVTRQGFNYWATAVGLHQYSFELANGSTHSVLFNAIMKCGTTSMEGAFQKHWKLAHFIRNVTTSNSQNNINNSSSSETAAQNQTTMSLQQGQQLVNDLKYLGMLRKDQAANVSRQLFDAQQHQAFLSTRALLLQQQQSPPRETFEYFANVRDPVSRFVSATAQEMYVHHKRRPPTLRTSCLKTTGQETLRCALDYVKKKFGNKLVRNPHFIPMAVVLLRRTFGYNTEIKLFDMAAVSDIVTQIAAFDEDASQKASIITARNTHDEEGKDQGSDVLKNMSVMDLTHDMIQEICDLYQVDVIMLESLGIPSRCSKLFDPTLQKSEANIFLE